MQTRQHIIWKVRTVKPYHEARNHLFVGRVLERDAACVRLLCLTFHYGRLVTRISDIATGPLGTRILPWARIEVINELPAGFCFEQATVRLDKAGSLVLSDGTNGCILVSSRKRGIATPERPAACYA